MLAFCSNQIVESFEMLVEPSTCPSYPCRSRNESHLRHSEESLKHLEYILHGVHENEVKFSQ